MCKKMFGWLGWNDNADGIDVHYPTGYWRQRMQDV